jgi:hypothetical protein
LRLQGAGVSQDVEHRIRDAGRGTQIEAAALDDFIGDEDHVAQHREQVILQTADHFAVDERGRRRVLDLELDAPCLATMRTSKSLYFSKMSRGVVDVAAGIQHGERAFAEQGIQAALAGIEQLGYFLLGQMFEGALRRDPGIDQVRG